MYHKLRYSLSNREIEEILLNKGVEVDHSTLQRWVEGFLHLLDSVFSRNKKELKGSWYLDETYIKVNGKWHYYYRMIDRDNCKVTLLSKNRDKKAVKICLKKSMIGNDVPFMITSDRSGSNLSALLRYNLRNKEKKIYIRDVKYKNN